MIDRNSPIIFTPAQMVDGDMICLSVHHDDTYLLDMHVEGSTASDRCVAAGSELITETLEEWRGTSINSFSMGMRALVVWLNVLRAYRNNFPSTDSPNDDDYGTDPVPVKD